MSNPDPRHALLIHDPNEVDLALARWIGLGRPVFLEAGHRGDLARRRTTRDNAPGAPGYYLWDGTLTALRVLARREHDWHNDFYGQIPTTENVNGTVCLSVSSGNDLTGRIGDDPSTKNVKGGDALLAIAGNNKIPFGRTFDEVGEVPPDFWYFLVNAGPEGVWAEVSKPSSLDKDGFVTTWDIRIIIGRIDPDNGFGRKRKPEVPSVPSSGSDIGSGIDVKVDRKSA